MKIKNFGSVKDPTKKKKNMLQRTGRTQLQAMYLTKDKRLEYRTLKTQQLKKKHTNGTMQLTNVQDI